MKVVSALQWLASPLMTFEKAKQQKACICCPFCPPIFCLTHGLVPEVQFSNKDMDPLRLRPSIDHRTRSSSNSQISFGQLN